MHENGARLLLFCSSLMDFALQSQVLPLSQSTPLSKASQHPVTHHTKRALLTPAFLFTHHTGPPPLPEPSLKGIPAPGAPPTSPLRPPTSSYPSLPSDAPPRSSYPSSYGLQASRNDASTRPLSAPMYAAMPPSYGPPPPSTGYGSIQPPSPVKYGAFVCVCVRVHVSKQLLSALVHM